MHETNNKLPESELLVLHTHTPLHDRVGVGVEFSTDFAKDGGLSTWSLLLK